MIHIWLAIYDCHMSIFMYDSYMACPLLLTKERAILCLCTPMCVCVCWRAALRLLSLRVKLSDYFMCKKVVAVCRSVLQCVAVCLRVSTCVVTCVRHVDTRRHTASHCNTLQHTATHCNYFRVYVCCYMCECCSVLQCVAVWWSVSACVCVCLRVLLHVWDITDRYAWVTHVCITWYDTATNCIPLQHTATHCNTLQHTATFMCASRDMTDSFMCESRRSVMSHTCQ